MKPTTLSAGSKSTLYCSGCLKEYELLYEPKAVGDAGAAASIERAAPRFCPFCGNDDDVEEA